MDSNPNPNKISLCTFVKNEELCITHMLKSVSEFVEEIIIVDTGSFDNTLKICKDFPKTRVYEIGFTDFGKIRTITAHLAKQPWILLLDADETLSNPEKLIELASVEEVEAYALPRKRWLDLAMTQQTETEAYPDWQVRFYKNDPRYIWKRELHEYFDGGVVTHKEDGPVINHFQDVFKDEIRKKEREMQYSFLALQAGVSVHGGKPL